MNICRRWHEMRLANPDLSFEEMAERFGTSSRILMDINGYVLKPRTFTLRHIGKMLQLTKSSSLYDYPIEERDAAIRMALKGE